MNKPNQTKNNHKANLLMTTGFAVLLPGLLLASLVDSNLTLQIIGVVLTLIAAALFGASIGARGVGKSDKK